MADAFTPNFNLGKPEQGSARNRWGGILNDTIDKVDTALADHSDRIDARVKIAGDAMTGSLSFDTNGKGIVYSANTRAYDSTNGNTGVKSHFMDLAGSALRMRTEDGSIVLFKVDTDGVQYRGKNLLVTGDGSYVSTTGGKIDGNLDVTGLLTASTLRLDDKFTLTMVGDRSTINVGSNASFAFDRSSSQWTWIAGGQVRMSLDGQGNLNVSGDATGFSDARLKTDIVTLDGALDKLQQVRGVSFTRKADGSKAIGVIAQEIETVFPQAVHTNDEGIKAVAYGNLVAPLIEAVKELSAKIAVLEAKVAGK